MGNAEEQYSFSSIVAVATPCWGSKSNMVDFQLLADTLLLSVLCGHMCKFLGVGEEFIFMRKIFWKPEYFFVNMGLVVIYIKTYFILKYPSYTVKMDC